MPTIEQLESVPHGHENGAWTIAQLSGRDDVGNVITGGCDGHLRTWSLNSNGSKPRGTSTGTDMEIDGASSGHRGILTQRSALPRHALPVVQVAVSKERDVALSTSLDGKVKVSGLTASAGDAKDLRPPPQSLFDAWAVCAARSSEVAVVGGANGTLHAIDTNLCISDLSFSITGPDTDTKTSSLEKPMVMSLALSADDTRVVAGTSDGRVVVLDVESGAVVSSTTTAAAPAPVRSVAYIVGERNSVVVARDDGLVSVLDVASGDTTAALRGHAGMVFTAQASINGRYVASGGADTTVKVWDRAERSLIFNSTAHTQPVWSVAWTAADSHIVSVGDDDIIGILQCHGKE